MINAGNAVYKVPWFQMAFTNAGLSTQNVGGLLSRTKPDFFLETSSRAAITAISDTTINNKNDSQGHSIFQDFHSFQVF
jgi:hypothetical protein